MHTNRARHLPAKPTNKTLRILLVDDQKFVQQKLQQMLSPEADLEIVGIANDGETAIEMVADLQPNVVLIDIEMPKMNGIEATKIITQRFPNCKILILSSHEHSEYVQKIIAAGADGYVLKTTPPEDLIIAIHAVCKGYSHFGSQLLKKVKLARSNDIPPAKDSSSISDRNNVNTQQLTSKPADDLLPPVSKWLTWGGISIVTAIALSIPAAAIFNYKTVVKARAIARPAEELHLVQAPVAGKVAQILVKEGQSVKKGQAIATIDLSRIQTRRNQLEKSIQQQKLQLAQLEAQLTSLSNQIVAETQNNQAEIATARSQLVQEQRNYRDKNVEVTSHVEEAQARVRAVEATLNAAKAKYNRYKSVAQAGAIGKDRLAEAELEFERQKQELKAARAKLEQAVVALNPSTMEIEIARQRIEQAKKSGRATIAGLEREKETSIQQRIEIERQLEQDLEELNQINKELTQANITATATGTIFQLSLRNREQTLQPGEEIAKIVPKNFEIEMKAAVPPQDILQLKVGQKVQMQVSACPYPDYGTLGGKVSQIAKDTNKPNNNTQSREAGNLFYEVSISPNSSVFGKGEKQCLLKLGMESKANIISHEETVLQFILRKARLTTNL